MFEKFVTKRHAMSSSKLTKTRDYEDFRKNKKILKKFVDQCQGSTEITPRLIEGVANLMVSAMDFKELSLRLISNASQKVDKKIKRKLAAYQYVYNLFVDTAPESSSQPNKIAHNDRHIDRNIAITKEITGLPLQVCRIKDLMNLVEQVYRHHSEQLKSAILAAGTDIPKDASITITTSGKLSVRCCRGSDTGPTCYDREDCSSTNPHVPLLSTQMSVDASGYSSDSTSCDTDSCAKSACAFMKGSSKNGSKTYFRRFTKEKSNDIALL